METQPSSSAPPPKPRKKRRLLKVFLAILAVLVFLHLPIGQEGLRVSPETTVVTGPLNPDGTVDYVAALNAECSVGVTPENNAAPLLLRALGRSLIRPLECDAYDVDFTPDERILGSLGLKAGDLDGNDTFVLWADWLKKCQKSSAPATQDANTAKSEDEARPYAEDALKDLLAGCEHPQLEPWLGRNAAALDMLARATRRPRYYLPLVSHTAPARIVDAELEDCGVLREATVALRARAELRAAKGDMEGAWQDVLTLHRLARLVAQKPLVVLQLVAMGLDDTAATSGIRLVTRWTTPPATAGLVARELKALGPGGSISQSIRGERFMLLDMVMQYYRGPESGPGKRNVRLTHFLRRNADVNVVLQRCNWWWDRIDRAMHEPSLCRRIDGLNAIDQELAHRHSGWQFAEMTALWIGGWPCRTWFSSDLAEDMLLPILLPNLSGGEPVQARGEMELNIEMLAIALARYRADQHRWPEKLDELVPKYADAIPPDIFTDKTLTYVLREDGYLLYSVGRNLRDDGGRSGTKQNDDIVARVPADANEPSTRPKP